MVLEEKIYFFRNQPIRKKNGLWRPCLLTDRNYISNLYRGPYHDASYQVLIHLGKRFQRGRFLRNQPIRNKNELWRPCLLTDRDEMSNLYNHHYPLKIATNAFSTYNYLIISTVLHTIEITIICFDIPRI